MTSTLNGVALGVAYYPEYQPDPRPDQDLDAMKAIGIRVIRVGESVWSTWEPRDGHFDVEWLAPTMDAAHERGIGVILGTPTYAIPPWLQHAHPEIAAEVGTGIRVPWGSRQEVDFTHPVFRHYAERVIRVMLERYAPHPAVIGYQLDNEPGLHLLHNRAVFEEFVSRLERRYGSIEALNQEWGLAYWSHRLSAWDELWRPDGNSFPQYDLAWRRFQADLTTEFIAWQAGLVRALRRPGQFVTTCLQYPRRALDDAQLAGELDVTGGNPYYAVQDRLALDDAQDPPASWISTGAAALFRQGDRMYSSRQERFLVTETNAQAISGPGYNHPPYPGQLVQSGVALVARGAALVEYWHWNTLSAGAETYWGGVLPHSGRPGRIAAEVAQLGVLLGRLDGVLDGYRPDADVAVLWSTVSRFALAHQSPFVVGGESDGQPFERIVDVFHRGVIESGCQARIVHVEQAAAAGAAELAQQHPVLIAAGVYAIGDADLSMLREYARLGGHLVIGPRTGYADLEGRARVDVAPPGLSSAAGVSYEEFANIEREVPVVATEALPTAEDLHARFWIDGLRPGNADVLAGYSHPHFGSFAAVTTHAFGAGRVTTVGCLPSPALAQAIVRWVMPSSIARRLFEQVGHPATISSGIASDGRRVVFVFNWGWEPIALRPRVRLVDVETGQPIRDEVGVGAWGTRVLLADAMDAEPARPLR